MDGYTDIDLRNALAVGPLLEEQPFDGDIESTILRQRFWQLAESFRRLPLDTPHPVRASHYLIRETDPHPVQNGVVEFQRVYAAIPRPRVEPESYGFTVPGIDTLGEFAAKGVESAISAGALTTIATTAAHGFAVGAGVVVSYFVTFPDQSQALRQVFRLAETGTAGTTLIVARVSDSGTIYWPGASVFPPPGRDPYTLPIPSLVHFDYFLPGISTGIRSATDIPVLRAWTIIDGAGNITQRLSDTTTPTIAQYRQMIANREQIIAEASIVRRWMGNIFERVTRYVTAT